MSKIGNQPILVPEGVEVTVSGVEVEVSGPKGKLTQGLLTGIEIVQADNKIQIIRKNDQSQTRAFHGLMRALLNNMVIGVTEGWKKKLELVGTGYRAALQGQSLSLSVGYSHPVVIEPVEGISFMLDGQTKIEAAGIDRQLVGQMAAKIRAARPPEPYKGKGIRYVGEKVRRKSGKAASSGAGS